MTENQYAIAAGILLSLVFSYFPYLKEKYAVLRPDYQQLIQLGVLAILVFGRLGLGCLGRDATFQCTSDGTWQAAEAFIVSVIANAGTYKATEYIGTKKAKP
jgi:hypothetical protein